ncbi:MAG: hypothetical protein Q9159_004744 [Coniocarpon cinnabarinum]
MFYSETLLAKTGPLARVWLSANVERKLSKSQVLSSNLNDSVHAIVDRGQAPLALRLSGQLLLGVVRIYSRKARYLLDDCNEAILKIKMAFRPGNVDLPAHQSHTTSSAALNLPDVLTEVDLLAPGPDLSLLLAQDEDPSLLLEPSQNLPNSVERGRATSTFSDGFDRNSGRAELPIEQGRAAGRAMADNSTMIRDEDVLDDGGIQFDDIDDPLDEPRPVQYDQTMDTTALDELAPQPLNDEPLGGMDEPLLTTDEQVDSLPAAQEATSAPLARTRSRDRSESVLSELDPNIERELEQSFHARQSDLFSPERERSFHAPQRAAKKRKILHADVNTQLRNEQIRSQQEDRSKILKPAAFLPRDPVLLALMEMQKNGAFVSSILGDGMNRGLAPELRGVLSLEVVRSSGDLKRKRDSGVAGVESEPEVTPELEFHDARDVLGVPDLEQEHNVDEQEEPAIQIPADSQLGQVSDDQPDDEHPADNFDETTMPLLHPSDAGPVSLGTKHAVHLLREKLGGPSAQSSPSKRVQSSVLFTDLCPEKVTTRADATKMFFETLVLATKDAVKVEQPSQEGNEMGGLLRVRAKRGLWGDWAEMGTEGDQVVAASG